MPESWNDWASLGTLVTLVFLCIQMLIQSRQHKLELLTTLFSELNTVDFRNALRYVYSKSAKEMTLNVELSEKDLANIELVTAHLDRLAFRLRKKLVPENDCYDLFWDIVIRSAQQLQEHIESQRNRRKNIVYKRDFLWMAYRFKLLQLKKLVLNKEIKAKLDKIVRENKSSLEILKIEPLECYNVINKPKNEV